MEEKETVRVPIEVIESTHREGFFKQVRSLNASHCTMREAYDRISSLLEEYGLPVRYTSFESFESAYYAWSRKLLGKDSKAATGIKNQGKP